MATPYEDQKTTDDIKKLKKAALIHNEILMKLLHDSPDMYYASKEELKKARNLLGA